MMASLFSNLCQNNHETLKSKKLIQVKLIHIHPPYSDYKISRIFTYEPWFGDRTSLIVVMQ